MALRVAAGISGALYLVQGINWISHRSRTRSLETP
jgi:hypothetical protein